MNWTSGLPVKDLLRGGVEAASEIAGYGVTRSLAGRKHLDLNLTKVTKKLHVVRSRGETLEWASTKLLFNAGRRELDSQSVVGSSKYCQ